MHFAAYVANLVARLLLYVFMAFISPIVPMEIKSSGFVFPPEYFLLYAQLIGGYAQSMCFLLLNRLSQKVQGNIPPPCK